MQPVIDGDRNRAKHWWTRNWKWCLPASALSVAGLALVVAFVGLIAATVVGSLTLVRTSSAARTAVARAATDPEVVSALGAPIEEGWLVDGTLDPGRYAKLTVPISGPNGRAHINLEASCKNCRRGLWPFNRESDASDAWKFSTLAVEIGAEGQRIDILAKGTQP